MKTRSGKSEDWYAISPAKDRRGARVFVVNVKRHGLTISNSFSASRHGGDEAALTAARQWRDRVLAVLPAATYRQLYTRVRKNSTSGIPGVRRETKRSGAYWVATCRSAKNPRVKHFSVDEYGEDRARELALEARCEMLKAVPDRVWLATPAAKAFSEQVSGFGEDAFRVSWDSKIQEQLLARLRGAGLIDKPRIPPVRRRDYPSQGGPVWEAMYQAPKGQKIFRRFSVAKYGEEEAQRLAEEAYAKLETQHSTGPGEQKKVCLVVCLSEAADRVLDVVQETLELSSDAALARTLGVAASTLSKVRQRRLPLGPALLVRVLEETQLHIRDLYALTQTQ